VSPRPKTTHLRREQITRAALEAIAERGFQEVRVADIARRAGTSAPAVLYHFDSKDEILDAAVSLAEDTFYAEVDATLQEPAQAGQRLVRLLECGCGGDAPADVAMWKVWLEIYTRALRNRHTARTRQLLDRRWRATLATTIRDGQARGEFSPAVDAELVALQLAALMDGLAIQLALGDPDISGERMTEVLLDVAQQTLACDLAQYLTGTAGIVRGEPAISDRATQRPAAERRPARKRALG
jgi:AcrR family transcriptional regulator